MLKLTDFDYFLPDEAIAQAPAVPRDSSKLLFLNRNSGEIEHHHFFDLPNLLDENCVLVRNNTKVMPARIYGQKKSGGAVEILLEKRIGLGSGSEGNGEVWSVLSKPGLKMGQEIIFDEGVMTATCVAENGYTRNLQFNLGKEDFFVALDKIGHTPIPPYIHWASDDEQELREIYQTIYAKFVGSVAAPTAGLHFTKDLDEKLKARGVEIYEVTLHVGLGTFLPVKDQNIAAHHMHGEFYVLDENTALALNAAKKNGKKIISVGTTTTRVLESCADERGELKAGQGETKIYIYPPYQYKFVDGMITNFHLPKSTLLMMVSAFVCAPNTKFEFSDFLSSSVGKAYQEAIENNYRFYSFGDGMMIM